MGADQHCFMVCFTVLSAPSSSTTRNCGLLRSSQRCVRTDALSAVQFADAIPPSTIQEIEDMGFEATPIKPVVADTITLQIYGMT